MKRKIASNNTTAIPPAPKSAYFPLISHCFHLQSEQLSDEPNQCPDWQDEDPTHQTQLTSLMQESQSIEEAHPLMTPVVDALNPSVVEEVVEVSSPEVVEVEDEVEVREASVVTEKPVV